MVAVTRLDKQLMYLNPDHIICIEETPDTVITLFNGNRYLVIDRASAIISRIVAFRAKISRRAEGRAAKKYLGRTRAGQFHRNNSPIQADAFPDNQGRQNHIPLHGRD
jgi:flagellar protein FlbD